MKNLTNKDHNYQKKTNNHMLFKGIFKEHSSLNGNKVNIKLTLLIEIKHRIKQKT